MRECPACGAEIDMSMLACKVDWFRLPKPFQRAVTRAWRRRVDTPRDEGARTAHEAAKAAAERWYAEHPAGAP